MTVDDCCVQTHPLSCCILSVVVSSSELKYMLYFLLLAPVNLTMCCCIFVVVVSSNELQGVLLEIISTVGCDMEKPAHVVVARDTR